MGAKERSAKARAGRFARQTRGPVAPIESRQAGQDATNWATYGRQDAYGDGSVYAPPGIGKYGTAIYGGGAVYDGPEVEADARYGYVYYGRHFTHYA